MSDKRAGGTSEPPSLKFDVHTTTNVYELDGSSRSVLRLKQSSAGGASQSRSNNSNTCTVSSASGSGHGVGHPPPVITVTDDEQSSSDKFYDAPSTPAPGGGGGGGEPLQRVHDHVQHLRTRVEMKTSHLSTAQKQNAALKAENDELRVTVTTLRADLDSCTSRLARAEQLAESRTEQTRQAGERSARLADDKAALRQENDELRSRLSTAGQGDFDAQLEAEEQILALETKLAQKSARVEQLEAELAALKCAKRSRWSSAAAVGHSVSDDATAGELRAMRRQLDGLQKALVVKEAQLTRCTCAAACAVKRRPSSVEDALVNKVHTLNAAVAEMKRALDDRADATSQSGAPANVHEEVGTLRATNKFLGEKVAELECSIDTLNKELSVSQAKCTELEEEVASVRQQLEKREEIAEGSHKYMEKELSNAKRQKVDLRLQKLDVERKLATAVAELSSNEHKKALEKCHVELEAALADVQSTKVELASATSDNDTLLAKVAKLESEIKEEQKRSAELTSKLETAESDLAVRRDLANHGKKKLEERIDTLTKETVALRAAYNELEVQFDEENDLRKRTDTKATQVQREHDEHMKVCNSQSARWRADNEKRDALLLENVRLKKKAEFLQEELEATHADYKEELARVAAQVRDAKIESAQQQRRADSPPKGGRTPTQAKAADGKLLAELKAHREHAEAESRRLHAELGAAKRLADEFRADNDKLNEQLSQQSSAVDVAASARAKLESAAKAALEKGERYKRERDDVAASVQQLKQAVAQANHSQKDVDRYRGERDELRKECDKIELQSRQTEARLREEVRRLSEQKAQVEKLADYLQGQVSAPGTRKRDKLALWARPPSPNPGAKAGAAAGAAPQVGR